MKTRFQTLLLLLPAVAFAADPDTLILNDGEKLIGHFERSNGSTVTFKSDFLGEVNVDWSKIKELHASEPFVVVGKNVKLGRRAAEANLPKGAVDMTNQTITVEVTQIPVAEAAHVIDQPTFERDIERSPGFFQEWNGGITAGASIVEATQQSRTFTGSINLTRVVPQESWINARYRTLLNFSASTGFLDQPGTPRVKTDIYHIDAEQDQYFRGKDLYGFVQTDFDHNYSQGLRLQSNYGGGLGYTVIKKNNESLDVKGSMIYSRQSFLNDVPGNNLFGSTFAENFLYKTKHGVQFLESITATPAWNNLQAYGGAATASVAVPLYKRLTYTTGLTDTFLNNPAPGFRKNSFQFTTGLTYSLR
jgi:hypothetical protein